MAYFMIGGGFFLLIPLLATAAGQEALLHELATAAPPPPPPREICRTFNAAEYDDRRWEVAYGRLIEYLRTQLGSGSRWPRLGVPVLHPQTPDGEVPTLWWNLTIHGDDGNVTFRIRMDNLYVVGFQRAGGSADDGGQWWELRHEDKRALISGSKPLGFSCNYNHLEGTAGQSTLQVGLGRHRLRDAVSQLAGVQSPDGDRISTARSVMTVIIMVAEAIRFREIAEHLITDRGSEPNADHTSHLTPRMNVLTRGWGDISEHVFHADQNPERSRFTFPLTLRQGTTVVVIFTAYAAETLLGVLLCPTNCPWRPGPRMLLLVAAPGSVPEAGADGGGPCAEGRPLMEVISVIINDIDGENPGQLYGTVTATDALGAQSVYDRPDPSSYESIYPGQAATLTGPKDRAISALGAVTIHLDLWDRDFTVFNSDDQVSKGSAQWDHQALGMRYDTRLSQMVRGSSGSATVNYIVFRDAVEAKFEIKLIRGNDGQQDEVYGRIVARIGDLEIESVLLSTTSSTYSQVWYGDHIPLQRTVVALPLSSYVKVKALLYDYDSSSADDEIAGGCTYFGAKSSGTTAWRIAGQSGEIEVKVTWNPSY